MNVLSRWFLRWRGLPLLALIPVVILPVVLLTRGGSDGESSRTVPQMILLGLVLIFVLILIVKLAMMLAGVDPDATAIAKGLVSAPDQQRLLTRWLERSRWARNVGGLVGITWWVLGTSMQGDVLLYGVGGIALGSMATQLHHVRRPSGPRTASLARRSVADYLPTPWRRRMIAVAFVSAALTLAGVILDDDGGATGWGMAALVVLAGCHLVQRRVASRPRPALGVELQQADDLARTLAIDRGLAQPGTYFALALIAHGSADLAPTLGGAAVALSVVTWLYAFYAWWQNRRLGLDDTIGRSAPVLAVA